MNLYNKATSNPNSCVDCPIKECIECGNQEFIIAELTKEEIAAQKDLETRHLLQCKNCGIIFIL